MTFKSSLLPEQYFDCVTLKCYQDALIKIQLGVLPINSNKFRYSEGDRKKLRDFRQSQVEDEFHFVCVRYIRDSEQNILIPTCARKILSYDCFVAVQKQNAGSMLHLLFTPSN